MKSCCFSKRSLSLDGTNCTPLYSGTEILVLHVLVHQTERSPDGNLKSFWLFRTCELVKHVSRPSGCTEPTPPALHVHSKLLQQPGDAAVCMLVSAAMNEQHCQLQEQTAYSGCFHTDALCLWSPCWFEEWPIHQSIQFSSGTDLSSVGGSWKPCCISRWHHGLCWRYSADLILEHYLDWDLLTWIKLFSMINVLAS